MREINTPTEAQLKKFWKWCGFYQDTVDFADGNRTTHDKCWCNTDYISSVLPELDLNNLFKYAVPKLFKPKYAMYSITFTRTGAELETHHEDKYSSGVYHNTWNDKEYALALFWAIYKLIEDDKEVK